MSLAEEYKVLERRYLAARQQIEKLQSNIQILTSTNDDLTDISDDLRKQMKEYKKAFEEIFIHHVGASWDNIPPDERDKMSLTQKIEFYKREVSNTQAYMRKSFDEFQGGAVEQAKKLEEQLKEEKRKNNELQTEILNLKKDTKKNNRIVNSDYMDKIKKNQAQQENKLAEPSDEKGNSHSETQAGMRKAASTPFSFDKIKKNRERLNQKDKIQTDKEKKDADAKNILNNLGKERKENKAKEPEKNVSTKEETKSKLQQKTIENPEKGETKPATGAKQKSISEKQGMREKFSRLSKEEQKKIFSMVIPLIDPNSTQQLSGTTLHTFYAIGSTGLFATKDITSIMSDEKDASFGGAKVHFDSAKNASRPLLKLSELGLISSQKIKTAGAGASTNCYELTSLGKWTYWLGFQEEPEQSVLSIISKDQKSLQHAVDIMLLANTLKNLGYKCRQEFGEMTEEGGSISDILADKGNYRFCIEYEEGNYNADGYAQKFRRINLRGRNVIFVGKDKTVAKKLEDQYKDFLAAPENEEFRDRPALFLAYSEFQGGNDPLMKLTKM